MSFCVHEYVNRTSTNTLLLLLLSIILENALPSHWLRFTLITNMGKKLTNTNIMITRYTASNILSQFHSTWVLVWTSDSQTCNHDPQIMRHQCSSLIRHHLVLSPSLSTFVWLNYPCRWHYIHNYSSQIPSPGSWWIKAIDSTHLCHPDSVFSLNFGNPQHYVHGHI